MARAQAGDASVWDEWFELYYPPLFRYAYIRLRRRSEAEDIVSQVFVEAYRGVNRYTYTGKPLLAWLYRIAHNLIFDKQKADARHAAFVADEAGASDGPETHIDNIDLLRAVESLGDEQREVIVLRYFMAMSAQEAAVLLGKTPSAVFSLQARAIVNLRRCLGEDFEL